MTAATEQKQLPETAPRGFYFYLATTLSPTDKKRRYLHSIHRPEKPFREVHVTLSPTRSLAKPFDRLALARAYADFLNRMEGAGKFCIVLEAGSVLDQSSAPSVAQGGELKGSLKRYAGFRWE